ncbi:MAG: response regulator [Cyanobacteria bacterium P01_A01_bin.135]
MEDSSSDANLFMRHLDSSQVVQEVVWVKTGEEALMYLRQTGQYTGAPRPDLIVLDLMLPGLSGQDLLAIVKADPLLRQIPVLVLTGSAQDNDVYRVYSLHANCYVEKPIDPKDYRFTVKTIEAFWLNLAVLPPKQATA